MSYGHIVAFRSPFLAAVHVRFDYCIIRTVRSAGMSFNALLEVRKPDQGLVQVRCTVAFVGYSLLRFDLDNIRRCCFRKEMPYL